MVMSMFKKQRSLFTQPYPLFTEPRKVIPGALVVSLFVAVFIMIFQPFGIDQVQITHKVWYIWGFALVILAGLLLNYLLLTRLFPKVFSEDDWQVGKEIVWLLWNIFSVGLLADIYFYFSPLCRLDLPQLLGYLGQGVMIAVIPETIYVLFTYSIFLTRRLQAAESLNRKLSEKLPGPGDALSANETQLLTDEKGKEMVQVSTGDLLFIRSAENYSNIVWQEKGQLKKALLRSSLKSLDQQINASRVLRCHRSFIVNLQKVRSVTGNARGYRLYLDSYSDPIPVSREAGQAVLAELQKMAG